MKSLTSKINEALLTEARKTKKTVDAIIDVFFASLKWIKYGGGIDEFINWSDTYYNWHVKGLEDMLSEGGTKDSAAADEYFNSIVKLYKVFQSADICKYIFQESLIWIHKGDGLKEFINWADSELDKYPSTKHLKDELSNGGTDNSAAADKFFEATVEFYKKINFK